MHIGKKILCSATKCRHLTYQSGEISAYGRSVELEMPQNEFGSVDYCLNCISEMTIRCVRCGNAIFVYEPIKLYAPGDNPSIPVYAKFFEGKFVGCRNSDCVDECTDLDGFWGVGKNGKGFVLHAQSMAESFYQLHMRHRSSPL